jgi:hypothetical protein
MNSNFLARIFDWIGDALERFNPSAFRFLAAVLPYLTPIPVAWLTAHSASTFLNLPAEVAFIFVFALEGVGLWFTSLLVDAVVDWIKSKNFKTFALVLIFGIVVAAYIFLLVNLNVTLETATGSVNPARSRVITLMCFLPLLTGVGNGYYKLKLDSQKKENENLVYERSQNERIRQERANERLEKYRIKHANGTSSERTVTNEQNVRSQRTNVRSERTIVRTNGELRTFVLRLLDDYERTNGNMAGVSEISKHIARTVNEQQGAGNVDDGYERYKGYVSQIRKEWLETHQQYLQ